MIVLDNNYWTTIIPDHSNQEYVWTLEWTFSDRPEAKVQEQGLGIVGIVADRNQKYHLNTIYFI